MALRLTASRSRLGLLVQEVQDWSVTEASFTKVGSHKGAALQAGYPWQEIIQPPDCLVFRASCAWHSLQATTGSWLPANPSSAGPATGTSSRKCWVAASSLETFCTADWKTSLYLTICSCMRSVSSSTINIIIPVLTRSTSSLDFPPSQIFTRSVSRPALRWGLDMAKPMAS